MRKAELPSSSGPPPERIIESRHLYMGRVLNLRLDTVERPDGRRLTREVVEHSPVVAMVPIDGDGNVLLVRQYRPAPDKAMLEIPAGCVDPGESLEEAAQRELQEEIGCRAGHLDRLSGFYVSPGYCSELIHMFLARDLSPSRLEHDDDEDIVVVPLSLAEALDKVRSGEIDDAKSMIGLLLAAKRLRV
ncbi:MAG TPA: NUDIX hydrolase [Dehalococcoidia bacterium]|nr:NUDIX hydrolase [Dehalococcoidia bacterium]